MLVTLLTCRLNDFANEVKLMFASSLRACVACMHALSLLSRVCACVAGLSRSVNDMRIAHDAAVFMHPTSDAPVTDRAMTATSCRPPSSGVCRWTRRSAGRSQRGGPEGRQRQHQRFLCDVLDVLLAAGSPKASYMHMVYVAGVLHACMSARSPARAPEPID
jgi:hypothetical protein